MSPKVPKNTKKKAPTSKKKLQLYEPVKMSSGLATAVARRMFAEPVLGDEGNELPKVQNTPDAMHKILAMR